MDTFIFVLEPRLFQSYHCEELKVLVLFHRLRSSVLLVSWFFWCHDYVPLIPPYMSK
jgi:hypothetical protein